MGTNPFTIQVGTNIPKSNIFIFENLLEHHVFKEVVKRIWDQVQETDSAKLITAKFKRLRKDLKIWSKGLSNLVGNIKAANNLLWDTIEEYKNLKTIA